MSVYTILLMLKTWGEIENTDINLKNTEHISLYID